LITSFRGDYDFLSNFYPSPVKLGGVVFPTAEHAFQAAKCAYADDVVRVTNASTPKEARAIGRQVTMREGWDDVKYDVMKAIIRNKFDNDDIMHRLVMTGDEEIMEVNSWGDTTWGICQGEGSNWLGIILMAERIYRQDQLTPN
jgi:N-glycosidase YbiA